MLKLLAMLNLKNETHNEALNQVKSHIYLSVTILAVGTRDSI